MSGLTALTLAAARDGLVGKEFSAAEMAKAHIEAIEAGRSLNAFITTTPERALEMAAESDRRIAAGAARPLEGLPLAIKDLFCTKGILTTAGSRILHNFVPPYESTVSGNLWRAGAVLLGKTNLDEFAMGSSNVTSWFGPVVNPWTEPGAAQPRVFQGSSRRSSASSMANEAMPMNAITTRPTYMSSTVSSCHARQITKPMPDWLETISAVTSSSSAAPQPSRMPAKITGNAPGSAIVV